MWKNVTAKNKHGLDQLYNTQILKGETRLYSSHGGTRLRWSGFHVVKKYNCTKFKRHKTTETNRENLETIHTGKYGSAKTTSRGGQVCTFKIEHKLK